MAGRGFAGRKVGKRAYGVHGNDQEGCVVVQGTDAPGALAERVAAPFAVCVGGVAQTGPIDAPASRAAMPGAEKDRWIDPEGLDEAVMCAVRPAVCRRRPGARS